MKELKIYLAGACKGLPDLGTQWREEATDYFSDYNDLFDRKIRVYNPTMYFPRDGDNSISNKQIKQFYLNYLIKNCDLVLVNLNNSIASVGTGQELQFAVDKEIPVVGFGKENVYEWLSDDCDVVFDTMEQALNYIVDYFI